jgi:hypothetical protein
VPTNAAPTLQASPITAPDAAPTLQTAPQAAPDAAPTLQQAATEAPPTRDTPTAEPLIDLMAQVRDLGDESHPRKGMLLSAANLEAHPDLLNQPEFRRFSKVKNADGNGGVLVTTLREAQKFDAAIAAGVPREDAIGRLTRSGTGKPQTDNPKVVQQKNEDGAVTAETVVDANDPAAVQSAIDEYSQEGRTTEVNDPRDVLARRDAHVTPPAQMEAARKKLVAAMAAFKAQQAAPIEEELPDSFYQEQPAPTETPESAGQPTTPEVVPSTSEAPPLAAPPPEQAAPAARVDTRTEQERAEDQAYDNYKPDDYTSMDPKAFGEWLDDDPELLNDDNDSQEDRDARANFIDWIDKKPAYRKRYINYLKRKRRPDFGTDHNGTNDVMLDETDDLIDALLESVDKTELAQEAADEEMKARRKKAGRAAVGAAPVITNEQLARLTTEQREAVTRRLEARLEAQAKADPTSAEVESEAYQAGMREQSTGVDQIIGKHGWVHGSKRIRTKEERNSVGPEYEAEGWYGEEAEYNANKMKTYLEQVDPDADFAIKQYTHEAAKDRGLKVPPGKTGWFVVTKPKESADARFSRAYGGKYTIAGMVRNGVNRGVRRWEAMGQQLKEGGPGKPQYGLKFIDGDGKLRTLASREITILGAQLDPTVDDVKNGNERAIRSFFMGLAALYGREKGDLNWRPAEADLSKWLNPDIVIRESNRKAITLGEALAKGEPSKSEGDFVKARDARSQILDRISVLKAEEEQLKDEIEARREKNLPGISKLQAEVTKRVDGLTAVFAAYKSVDSDYQLLARQRIQARFQAALSTKVGSPAAVAQRTRVEQDIKSRQASNALRAVIERIEQQMARYNAPEQYQLSLPLEPRAIGREEYDAADRARRMRQQGGAKLASMLGVPGVNPVETQYAFRDALGQARVPESVPATPITRQQYNKLRLMRTSLDAKLTKLTKYIGTVGFDLTEATKEAQRALAYEVAELTGEEIYSPPEEIETALEHQDGDMVLSKTESEEQQVARSARGVELVADSDFSRTRNNSALGTFAPSDPQAPSTAEWKWGRKDPNGYELSTEGDGRFSALVARLKDGRTIEEAYQLDVKGYRKQGNNWRLGKGQPSLNKVNLWDEYLNLWRQWARENPALIEDLREKARGKTLTDKFANTPISQARALAQILTETAEQDTTLMLADPAFTKRARERLLNAEQAAPEYQPPDKPTLRDVYRPARQATEAGRDFGSTEVAPRVQGIEALAPEPQVIASPAPQEDSEGFVVEEATDVDVQLGSPKQSAAFAGVVTQLGKLLGITSRIKVSDSHLALAEEANANEDYEFANTIGNIYARETGAPKGMHWNNGKGQTYIWINPALLKGTTTYGRAIKTLMHEMGHAFFKQTWGSADPQLKAAVEAAFDRFAREHPERVRQTNSRGEPMSLAGQREEWFADQVAGWVAATRAPRNLVEQFFKGLADSLKAAWEAIRKIYPLDQSVDDYIRAAIKSEDRTVSRSLDSFGALNDAMFDEGDLLEEPTPLVKKIFTPLRAFVARSPTTSAALSNMAGAAMVLHDKLIAPLVSRIYRMNIPAFNAIMHEFYHRVGDAGGFTFEHAVKNRLNNFQQEYEALFGKMSEEQKNELMEELREEKPANQIKPELQEKAAQFREFMRRMYAYQRLSGLPISAVRDYFPQVADIEELQKPDAIDAIFAAVKAAGRGETREQIAQTVANLTDDAMAVEIDVNQLATTEQAQGNVRAPFAQALRSRQLDPGIRAVIRSIKDDKGRSRFYDKNLDSVVRRYLWQSVRRAEYNKRLGDTYWMSEKGKAEGAKFDPHRRLNELLAQARQQKATEAQVTDMFDALSAMMGQYNRIQSEALRTVTRSIGFFQTLRTLLFVTVSSLPEITMMFLRSGEFSRPLQVIREKSGEAWKTGSGTSKMLRVLGFAVDEMDAFGMSEFKQARDWNTKLDRGHETFFRMVGLTKWTNWMRGLALHVGIDFMQRHAQTVASGKDTNGESKRRLDELGVSADDIAQWMKDPKNVYGMRGVTHEDLAAGNSKFTKEQLDSIQRVTGAIIRIVNDMVIHPEAAEKPLWRSDEHFMLVGQLGSYTYGFYNKALKRIWHELMRDGNATTMERVMPMLSLALMLPIVALGIELRQLVQYELWGQQAPTDKMDGFQYMRTLVSRTGALGLAQLGMDAYDAGSHGRSPFVSAMGPTINLINSTFEDIATADHPGKQILKSTLQGLPITSSFPGARSLLLGQ